MSMGRFSGQHNSRMGNEKTPRPGDLKTAAETGLKRKYCSCRPGIPVVPEHVDVVPAQERHRGHRGGVQAAEDGQAADADVEGEPDVRGLRALPEHRRQPGPGAPEAGQRGGGAFGAQPGQVAAGQQEHAGAPVGRVPGGLCGGGGAKTMTAGRCCVVVPH